MAVLRWLVFLVAVLAVQPAWAMTTGGLRVVVVDGDDLPVPGVQLHLESDTLIGGAQDRVTGASGELLFTELPPGEYELQVAKDGFSGVTVDHIAVHVNRTTSLKVVMGMGSMEEVVVGSRRSVRTESTSRGTALTKEFLKKVPGGRAYQSAVGMAAGETDGSDTPWVVDAAPVDAVMVPRHVMEAAEAPPEAPAAVAAVAAAPRPIPSVPALKAGATDDNADFGSFLDYLLSFAANANFDRFYAHMDVSGRRWIDVVDVHGSPLVGAEVQVMVHGQQEPEAVVTTHGDGRVAFYSTLSGPVETLGYDVFVDGELVEERWTGEDDLEVVVQDLGGPAQVIPVDVVLVLDTTGSMSDELARVKSTMLAVTERLSELDHASDLRLAAVRYRDRGDDYVTQVTPFSRDTAAFARMLRQTNAGGGGDGPESLNAALAQVNGLGFRPEAAKVAFVIADAPPHMDYDEVQYDDSVQGAGALGLKIHTVAASGLDTWGSLIYRQIAQFTRGQFIFIEYGGDVGRSAATHGVGSQVGSNNLDDILFERIRAEVEGYGR